MSVKIPQGIKDGKYIHISKFKIGDGRSCGCICPECGGELVSKIHKDKEKRDDHFAHYDTSSNCSGGQGETELHLLAKEIIDKNNFLYLPSTSSSKKLRFDYSRVELEKGIGKIRPDIVLYNEKNNQLLVEVAVTSFIGTNSKKYQEINRLGIPTLEIDLEDFYKERMDFIKTNRAELKTLLINSIEKKKWILEPNINDTSAFAEVDDSSWKYIIGGILTLFGSLFFLFKKKKKSSRRRKKK
jgi:LPXTG-motif cell wall-anchored protein